MKSPSIAPPPRPHSLAITPSPRRVVPCAALLLVALLAACERQGSPGNAQSASGGSTAQVERWRSDMGIFVKEVLDIAQRTTIPGEEPWTLGGIGGMKRAGTLLENRDGRDIAALPHGAGGAPGELGTELFRCFRGGSVSWRGQVEAADIWNGEHLVQISFPSHEGRVKVRPAFLRIPFTLLARDRSPSKGQQVSFTAELEADKTDTIFKDPVEVIYWFSSAGENGGDVWVRVALRATRVHW
jgi:hypothetical protein